MVQGCVHGHLPHTNALCPLHKDPPHTFHSDRGPLLQIPFGASLTVLGGNVDTTSAGILLVAAASLSSRFVPVAGVIR